MFTYNNFKKSNCKFHFRTRYCYFVEDKFDEVEANLDVKYVPKTWARILAGTIYCKIKFPKYLLEHFINCMKNLNNEGCTYIKELKKETLELKKGEGSDIKTKQYLQTEFIYGIDEFFLNTTFLKYIEENKIPFSVEAGNRLDKIFYRGYLRNKEKGRFNNPSKFFTDYYKQILGKYYDKNKSLLENHNFVDSIIYKKSNREKNKKRRNIHQYIFDNIMNVFEKIKKNNDYDKIGLTKKELDCISLAKDSSPYRTKIIKFNCE